MVRIGVTLGDPAGIGPEIVAKSLGDPRLALAEVTIIGNRENFEETVRRLNIEADAWPVFHFSDIEAGVIETGKISAESGRVASESIERAVDLALDGDIDGVCTAPVNKEALLLSGSEYKDHTGMLAGLTGTEDIVTLFETGNMRIIFLSKHVSLRDACDLVTKETVMKYIELADRSLRYLGSSKRRIGVAALNPHAGEGGMFGSEEKDAIIPAVREMSKRFDVTGPVPADSVFHQAVQGRYDVVLSMYHDQGHIAAKMLDFNRTVSMNLGLPFLRTSVDHGTAFDIAGKGIADETSMAEALAKCAGYSEQYAKRKAELGP